MPYVLNPFSGNLDYYSSGSSGIDNFLPQYYLASGDTVTIATKREMALHTGLQNFGSLTVLGSLVLIKADERQRSLTLYTG